MSFTQSRPTFVPADLAPARGSPSWHGALAHIGPVETVTPLLDRLAGTTTCGPVALCAGVALWAGWRFHDVPEAVENLQLAEAALAHAVDWRYLKWSLGFTAPDQPPERSASMQVGQFLREATDKDKFWDSYFQPVRQTFHAASIVRHVLSAPAREQFETWLERIADRIKTHHPKPDTPPRRVKTFPDKDAYIAYVAPHRGEPLPPEILDPEHDYHPRERAHLVERFLARLDPSTNPFLRTPEEMLALGFVGRPYGRVDQR
jgi:hypothetical protein